MLTGLGGRVAFGRISLSVGRGSHAARRCSHTAGGAGGNGHFDRGAGGCGAGGVRFTVDIERVAVEVDRARSAGETCDIAVSRQRPDRAVLDLHIDFSRLTVAVDRTRIGGIALEIEIEMRDIVDDHISVDGLVRRVERHLSAVAALVAPACRCCSQKDAVAVVGDGRTAEGDLGGGVIDKEHVAVLIGQLAAVHREGGESLRRVARHRLIDHDRLIVVRFVAVLGVVVGSEVDIVERHGVLALDHDALRGGGGHCRVVDRDVGGGVDDGRALAARAVVAARDGDGAAAAVGADRCRGVARGLDGEVLGVHRAAARRHQAARAVAARLNIGIRDVDRRALAVAEYRVCMGAVGLDDHLRQRERALIGREDRGVLAVEVGFVAVSLACLGHEGVADDLGLAVGGDRMLAVGSVFDRLLDGDVALCERLGCGGCRRRFGFIICRCRYRRGHCRLCGGGCFAAAGRQRDGGGCRGEYRDQRESLFSDLGFHRIASFVFV